MSSKLIIVTDLQRYKVYTTKVDPMGRESVELLENIDSLETHQRIREKVSDRVGNFQSMGGSGSAGEEHNLMLEEEKKRIKEIAKQISVSLQDHKGKKWYLAAPKAINNQIVKQLDSHLTDDLLVNLHLDLTKAHDNELLAHFNK